jgi:M6 family metalloprotease-like protein
MVLCSFKDRLEDGMPGSMMKRRRSVYPVPWLKQLAIALAVVLILLVGQASGGVASPVVIEGPQRLLIIAVRFPDVSPRKKLEHIEQKVYKVDNFIRVASNGKARLKTRLVGWYDMPAPLREYKVSPHNYQVDRNRVRRLVADAITAARRDVDLKTFDYFWIVVGVHTMPGQGYGMIAYAANPGMLTGVRRRKVRLEKVPLPGGGTFDRPTIVCAENAHPGHAAHDLLHALGGVKKGMRVVPDLYDFDLQSNPPKGVEMSPEIFAIHTGPWDIMSQHFIDRWKAPPLPSSFTKLQLGWIEPSQVLTVRPGETRQVALSPLSKGRGHLVVRVPLDSGRYLLVENRQSVGGDELLPASGMLVLEIDPSREEGAGIVKAADANPSVSRYGGAPYLPGTGERRFYENRSEGVAIAPLAVEASGKLRLVVTTPERISEFVTK